MISGVEDIIGQKGHASLVHEWDYDYHSFLIFISASRESITKYSIQF